MRRGFTCNLVRPRPRSLRAPWLEAAALILLLVPISAAQEQPAAAVAPIERRLARLEGEAGGACVVALGIDAGKSDHAGFDLLARRIAKERSAALVELPDVGLADNPDNADAALLAGFAKLESELRRLRPQRVVFVVPPDRLDVFLHRRLLLLSARLDDDPFPDFEFGYITARSAAAATKLWERSRALERRGLGDGPWAQVFVTTGIESTVWSDYGSELQKAAGFECPGYGIAVVESDPKDREFVKSILPRVEKASVLAFTGNGDPTGIWLFDDHRNVDRTKHWPFDPARVGEDKNGEMPRLLAPALAALKLKSPIVWSGTCHFAATRRVFVESDIVSTFGRVEKRTLYEMKPDESLCLAVLDAGAAALLAPIAANHGYVVSCEGEFALETGATLGATIKSTWDDVFLAAGGPPRLDLGDEAGEAVREDPMQGGGANRLLIGDPALAPFHATPHPTEKVVLERGKESVKVVVTWKPGFHWHTWDMFGSDRKRDGRIGTRIDLADLGSLLPADRDMTLATTATVTDLDGKPRPYVLTRAEPELFHGHRYLHLQANGPRDGGEEKGVRATFVVQIRPWGPATEPSRVQR